MGGHGSCTGPNSLAAALNEVEQVEHVLRLSPDSKHRVRQADLEESEAIRQATEAASQRSWLGPWRVAEQSEGWCPCGEPGHFARHRPVPAFRHPTPQPR